MDKSILLFVILLSPQLTMISNLTDVLKSTKKAKRKFNPRHVENPEEPVAVALISFPWSI